MIQKADHVSQPIFRQTRDYDGGTEVVSVRRYADGTYRLSRRWLPGLHSDRLAFSEAITLTGGQIKSLVGGLHATFIEEDTAAMREDALRKAAR